MEEVGARVVLGKRDFGYQNPSFYGIQNSIDNWNPNLWNWDSSRFVAKPLDTGILERKKEEEGVKMNGNSAVLDLNLGGGLNSVEEEEPVLRPNKRVRSGSPGSTNRPLCQVDGCREDLSTAKDYHRRHKVCEAHSKAIKAIVAKQMQRFCQQCSRFHPLSEFDEGKRSCRRRLAGHNRRRRKTQPEDVISVPGNGDNKGSEKLDIVNFLTAFSSREGKDGEKGIDCASIPDRDQLVQILSKLNSLPLPMDLAAKLPTIGSLNGKITDHQPFPDQQSQLNRKSTPSPSTMDLIAALSATLPSPHGVTVPQRSTHSSDSENTRSTCIDRAASPDLQKRSFPLEFPSVGGEKSSSSYHSPVEDSVCQVQETRMNLPLQLFSSSSENGSPPNPASSRKYFSSGSSNPMEDRSASSSPVVRTFFPVHSGRETGKHEKMSTSRDVTSNTEGSRTNGSILPLQLFSGPKRGADQAGYSSSGSDHSPSSLNSDAQDCTGRIIFKLFDKDPSHFPTALRTQIYNWLSNRPSDMESYIRPGCVVLSIYVSMTSSSWEQFEGNLHQRISLLVQDSESDFWREARFLVHAGRQLASHKYGKIRLCKSWRTWTSPELISVSPLAIVPGKETSLTLRGRNLTKPGTKIHCAYMGGYSSNEACESKDRGTSYDEVNMVGFKIQASSTNSLGRCFIEVENGFKGNSFPLIIANNSICKELRLLESEFDLESKACDIISEDHAYDSDQPRSPEEVLHFLNELGWLFQRTATSRFPEGSDYSLSRFKFLLIFSVERDYCALVKVLLDMLVESNSGRSGLSSQSVEMLTEIRLLSRAVKRKCRKMAELLINYSLSSSDDDSRRLYIFQPNLKGPGGITPLHLAASMSESEDIIDTLTNDPQQIGLSSWHSLVDSTGHSAYSYAVMTNNHSYNDLVARKLADRRNGQVTLAIEMAHSGQLNVSQPSSCAKCAIAATKFSRRIPGSQSLLQQPFVHSMLAIAAVCVCVCLFLRGMPDIGSAVPFMWETLDFGTS